MHSGKHALSHSIASSRARWSHIFIYLSILRLCFLPTHRRTHACCWHCACRLSRQAFDNRVDGQRMSRYDDVWLRVNFKCHIVSLSITNIARHMLSVIHPQALVRCGRISPRVNSVSSTCLLEACFIAVAHSFPRWTSTGRWRSQQCKIVTKIITTRSQLGWLKHDVRVAEASAFDKMVVRMDCQASKHQAPRREHHSNGWMVQERCSWFRTKSFE